MSLLTECASALLSFRYASHMVDSLEYSKLKTTRYFFLAKYPFILTKYANYQSLLKSSFDAPFYSTSLRASHAKPHHSSLFKTLKNFAQCLNIYWVHFRERCVVFLSAN